MIAAILAFVSYFAGLMLTGWCAGWNLDWFPLGVAIGVVSGIAAWFLSPPAWRD